MPSDWGDLPELPPDDPIYSEGVSFVFRKDPPKSTGATSEHKKKHKSEEELANDEGDSPESEDPNAID